MLWGVRVRSLVMPAPLEPWIEKFRSGFAGHFPSHDCVEGVETLAHDLHVLLRHRLLRQPGGFEGLGAIREDRPGGDLAGAKLPHMEAGLPDFATRRLHSTTISHGGKDTLPLPIAQFLDLDPPLGKCVPVLAPCRIELIDASVDAEARKPRRIECRVRCETLSMRLSEPVEMVILDPDGLHVLLRHRPPSIPSDVGSANGEHRAQPLVDWGSNRRRDSGVGRTDGGATHIKRVAEVEALREDQWRDARTGRSSEHTARRPGCSALGRRRSRLPGSPPGARATSPGQSGGNASFGNGPRTPRRPVGPKYAWSLTTRCPVARSCGGWRPIRVRAPARGRRRWRLPPGSPGRTRWRRLRGGDSALRVRHEGLRAPHLFRTNPRRAAAAFKARSAEATFPRPAPRHLLVVRSRRLVEVAPGDCIQAKPAAR